MGFVVEKLYEYASWRGHRQQVFGTRGKIKPLGECWDNSATQHYNSEYAIVGITLKQQPLWVLKWWNHRWIHPVGTNSAVLHCLDSCTRLVALLTALGLLMQGYPHQQQSNI